MKDLIPEVTQTEYNVLGSIILDNQQFEVVSEVLSEHNFLSPSCRIVFKAMGGLDRQEVPIDETTLLNYLARQSLMDKIGGSDFLMKLTSGGPIAVNAKHYAKQVRDYHNSRQVLTLTKNAAIMAEQHPDIDLFLDKLETDIEKIKSNVTPLVEYTQDDLFQIEFDTISDKMSGKKPDESVPTGLTDVDEVLSGGLLFSQLDILAGRPGMGKSSLALTIARNVSKTLPVLFVSIEMEKQQLARRLLSQHTQVPETLIMNGTLTNEQLDGMVHMAPKMSRTNLFIDDVSRYHYEVKRSIRKHVKKHGVRFVIVDYLQRVKVKDSGKNRYSEIGDVIDDLAHMAKRLKINILCLAQLNRGVEARPDKRPLLSDLSESGKIEEGACRVFLMYREKYYNQQLEGKDIVELNIGKNRYGRSGSVDLEFKGPCTSFHDVEQGGYLTPKSAPVTKKYF